MARPSKFVLAALLGYSLLAFAACGKTEATADQPAAAAKSITNYETDSADRTVRFFENRIKQNPSDFVAYNKLSTEYLRIARETGDAAFLELALRAANRSLQIRPAEQNLEGLGALALAKYSSHDFAGARDAGLQLTELNPNRGYTYQIFGDALLELGEYGEAKAAFDKMEEFGVIQIQAQVGTEQRLARLAFLYGNTGKADVHLKRALKLAESMPEPPPGTVGLCRLLLGEAAFSVGDYKTAERHFTASLAVYPEYLAGIAALGRVRAAQGDLAGAIDRFEAVTRKLPDPIFVAYLGDLYKLSGREADAERQYQLVEQIGNLSSANGTLYNRQLALFYADHDLHSEKAYTNAAREYESRRDIYGADALAWAALKAGKLPEAQDMIKQALRLGTRDSRLFYHAGMIDKAAGNPAAARKMLEAALKLNPSFDVLQAVTARNALSELR